MRTVSFSFRSCRRLAALSFLGVLLAACGGGGGNSPPGGNPPPGTTPDDFGFAPLDDAAPDLHYVSQSVTIAGIETGAAISIAAGSEGAECAYAVDDGAFTSAAGSIGNGQAVRIKARAAKAYETASSCVLTVGGVTADFTVTTGTDAFTFKVLPGRLALEWDGFAGVSRYELTRHNAKTGETAFVADDIAADAAAFETRLAVHLTDWINDRFLLSACNDAGCATLPDHEVELVQALSAQAVIYGKASNTKAAARFGYRVALDGDILAVSARFENSAARGVNGDQVDGCDSEPETNCAVESGAVYVFHRDADGYWQQEAYLKASNTGAGDKFGFSLAVEGDILVVGAPDEDSANGQNDDCESVSDVKENCSEDSGAVYTFRRSEGAWQQESYLKAIGAPSFAEFGYSIALEGNRLAVGSARDDTPQDSGAVRIYRYIELDDGTKGWAFDGIVKAHNAGEGDMFGKSVALDGDILVVGADREDSDATGVKNDELDDNNNASNSGAAYIFRDSGGLWSQVAYLKASNTEASQFFGSDVAVSGDLVAVGAKGEAGGDTGIGGNQEDDCDNASPKNCARNSGAVYLFRLDDTDPGNITVIQEAYVKASNTDEFDFFGQSVALDEDSLAVGASFENSATRGLNGDQLDDCEAGERSNCATEAGAVYVFHRDAAGVWTQQAYVKAANTGRGDSFGESVALDGDTLVVGARGESSSATGMNGDQANDDEGGSGAIYIY